MKRDGGLDAGNVVLVQSASHSVDRVDPRRADGNDFRNQRIVKWRHGVAGINVRVDPNAAPTWRIIKIDATRRCLKIVGRIFGIDTAFNRVQAWFRTCDTRDMRRKRLARGDADLLLHEVAS